MACRKWPEIHGHLLTGECIVKRRCPQCNSGDILYSMLWQSAQCQECKYLLPRQGK